MGLQRVRHDWATFIFTNHLTSILLMSWWGARGTNVLVDGWVNESWALSQHIHGCIFSRRLWGNGSGLHPEHEGFRRLLRWSERSGGFSWTPHFPQQPIKHISLEPVCIPDSFSEEKRLALQGEGLVIFLGMAKLSHQSQRMLLCHDYLGM